MSVNIYLVLLPALVASARATGVLARQATTDAPLPLTTAFTPPANCLTEVSLMSGYGYPTSYSVGLGPGNEFADCNPCWLGLASSSSCFPSGYSSSAVFSPGSCPGGYRTACSSVNIIGTVSETVVTCCPTGYLCAPQTRIDAYPWYSAQPCSYYPDTDLSITALSIGSGGETATSVFPASIATGYAILANSIELRFEASTTEGTAPSTTSNTEGTAPSTTSNTEGAAPSTSSSSQVSGQVAGPSGGLSPGAKAGIGVAAGVVGLSAIVGVIFYLVQWQKARSPGGPTVPRAINAQPYSDKQFIATDTGLTAQHELPVSGVNKVHELHGLSSVRELEG